MESRRVMPRSAAWSASCCSASCFLRAAAASTRTPSKTSPPLLQSRPRRLVQPQDRNRHQRRLAKGRRPLRRPQKLSSGYSEGFHCGYCKYVAAGGDGIPPAMPAYCLRCDVLPSPERSSFIVDYYAGYKRGADVRKFEGLRELVVVWLGRPPLPTGTGFRVTTVSKTDPRVPDPYGPPTTSTSRDDGAPGMTPNFMPVPNPQMQELPSPRRAVEGEVAPIPAVTPAPKPLDPKKLPRLEPGPAAARADEDGTAIATAAGDADVADDSSRCDQERSSCRDRCRIPPPRPLRPSRDVRICTGADRSAAHGRSGDGAARRGIGTAESADSLDKPLAVDPPPPSGVCAGGHAARTAAARNSSRSGRAETCGLPSVPLSQAPHRPAMLPGPVAGAASGLPNLSRIPSSEPADGPVLGTAEGLDDKDDQRPARRSSGTTSTRDLDGLRPAGHGGERR